MKTKKLTPAMRAVLDKMKDGWELGRTGGFAEYIWLQQGGIGRGGPSIDVHGKTYQALYDRGYITLANRRLGNPSIFKLTEAGKNA